MARAGCASWLSDGSDLSELVDAFRKSWQKAGDDIKMMKLSEEIMRDTHARSCHSVTDADGPCTCYIGRWHDEAEALETERDAWKEAFLATRAYYHNNNGPNSTRYRAAIKQLKEMKLIK